MRQAERLAHQQRLRDAGVQARQVLQEVLAVHERRIGMVIIGLIGLLLDGLTRLLERLKTVRWRYVR